MKKTRFEKARPVLGIIAAFLPALIVLIGQLQPPDGLRAIFLNANPVFQFAIFLFVAMIVLGWLWLTIRKFVLPTVDEKYRKISEALEEEIAIAQNPPAGEKAPISWTRPINSKDEVDFVRPENRQTKFVSVINLKGGVGKTTLTANLAGWLVKRKGFRVLVVDLDFQGTLTEYIAGFSATKQLGEEGRNSCRLHSDDFSGGDLSKVRLKISGTPDSYLIGATSFLETVDVARQNLFVYESRECRFDFRRIFHDPAVYPQYNVVLFDCPPRLTASSVNALACSDGYLVPTLPNAPSTFAVENLVDRASRIKPEAEMLGVVLNQADTLNGKQQKVVDGMMSRLVTDYGIPKERLFDAMVKQSGYLSGHVAEAQSDEAAIGQSSPIKPIPAISFDGVTSMLDDFGNEFCSRLKL